jgi:hypothetical protein
VLWHTVEDEEDISGRPGRGAFAGDVRAGFLRDPATAAVATSSGVPVWVSQGRV